MLKINYPENMKDIEEKYLKIFDINERKEFFFQQLLKRNKLQSMGALSLRSILIMSFEELMDLMSKMPGTPDKRKKLLASFFNYDHYQSKIADFFMEHKNELRLDTCYYCNIDYINVFKDLSDYEGGMDFIKRGSITEFKRIQWIGEGAAKIIDNDRERVFGKDSKLNKKQQDSLLDMKPKKQHNHFTLDHVIDKGRYPLFALSLYNFVPSCYSCNSKFKKSKSFISSDKATFSLSPTSKNFTFDEDVKFKIFFYVAGDEKIDRSIIDINSPADFILDFEYLKNEKIYKNYVSVFKLSSRYKFHKDTVVDLIKNSKKYPDTQLLEMAKNLGVGAFEIKKDIFGREVFDTSSEKVPLSKLKKDIASNIGVI